MNITGIIREFKLTSLALKNKTTIFILVLILIVGGLMSYNGMSKALFPDIVLPTVYVRTAHPGNSPLDIENLITRPLEKEINTIKGLNKLKSVSIQDHSSIFAEFQTDVDINQALLDVKDAVDRAKKDLPTDLERDPVVMEIDFSQIPIITINISGDYSLDDLKEYAEYLEEKIEDLPEINKAEIRGVLEKEMQIDADIHKMETHEISFNNIENAIRTENQNISGGDLLLDGINRSVRIEGEFEGSVDIENVVVKHQKGNIVYIKDIADVAYSYEKPSSIARLYKKPVVSIEVIKKTGENLLSATDAIYAIINQAKKSRFPRDLNVSITDDQSEKTRSQLSDLENSIISGMLLVIMVLYFFLGLRNALFVGLAIPMSMFVSFLVFGALGYTLNMVVLFSLILALGMLVDNAIVVIENMYRLYEQGYSAYRAAKEGVGEIAIAIISSTATTLAAFVPLLFWKDLMGEFMRFIPLTLIIVLSSSLFVALVLNPVIASVFIRKQDASFKKDLKQTLKKGGLFVIIGLVFLILGHQLNNVVIKGLAGLSFVAAVLMVLDAILFRSIANTFNNSFLPYLESAYLSLMDVVLKRGRPGWVILGAFGLLILSITTLSITAPKVEFFPVNMPTNINVFIEAPTGSDIFYTDSIAREVEKDVYAFVEPYQSTISSIITNVGKGTNDPKDGPSQGASPNKARIKITFKEFKKRGDVNTADVMKLLSAYLPKYPGIKIKVDKNREGPPRGKPVSIEVSGDDFAVLMDLSSDIRQWIDRAEIPGIEGLETDLDAAKPELLINVDRDKAKRFGISTSQIGSNLRTALFGKEVSKYKDGEDDYPIMLRLKEEYRTDLSALLNQKVTFRNKMNGKIVQVPASSVMDFEYDMSFGSVNRKDMQRVVTISSNVIEGYNANQINAEIEEVLSAYNLPEGYSIQFTGEQKEQGKAISFLSRALIIAVAMIWLILLSQFNSFLKPIIIVITVLFSTIGVFMGLAATGMDVVVILTGIGVVSLAGIVVNNAIVLIDYIDLVKSRRKESEGVDDHVILPREKLVEVIKEGGKTRLRPVLLTAITTVLGLIPLAIGLNIDFTSLITSFNPKIYFGGDNTIFWSPLAWTIIYGLLFATFLTLVVVPTLYLISERIRLMIRPLYIQKGDYQE